VARHRDVLQRLGLPTTYANAGFEELLATMRVDKKARGSQIRFVVLHGLGATAVLEPTDEQLRAAWERIGGGAA